MAASSQDPPSVAVRPLPRQTPEVGAVCGKPARTDLSGGRSAMDVPTAIEPRPLQCEADADQALRRPAAARVSLGLDQPFAIRFGIWPSPHCTAILEVLCSPGNRSSR